MYYNIDNETYMYSLQLITCTSVKCHVTYAPAYEKDNNLGFRPGMTQTGLYSQRK